MKKNADSANVRIPPPLLYLGVLLLAVWINNVLGLGGLDLNRPIRLIIGSPLLVGGVAVAASARSRFTKLHQCAALAASDAARDQRHVPMEPQPNVPWRYAGLQRPVDSIR